MMSIYTWRERNVKNYTVGQAVESAKRRLPGGMKYCCNAVAGRSLDEKITLEELNDLADAIYNDTIFWS